MTATAPDYDEIVRVVQLYVDGFNDCDISKFKEAFHDDAWIFFTDPDGALHKHLIADSFAAWASPPPSGIEGRIISVTQAGDIACVLLGFDNTSDAAEPGHPRSWVDFHALLRVDGVWRITNKTATHATRAAWAAERPSDRKEAATV
jgi:ketosteroid isomerase-like protein